MFRASLLFLGIYLAYLGFMVYNTTKLIELSRDNMENITNTIEDYER